VVLKTVEARGLLPLSLALASVMLGRTREPLNCFDADDSGNRRNWIWHVGAIGSPALARSSACDNLRVASAVGFAPNFPVVEVRTVEVRACFGRPLYLIISAHRDLMKSPCAPLFVDARSAWRHDLRTGDRGGGTPKSRARFGRITPAHIL
jgi:hypothetical protein